MSIDDLFILILFFAARDNRVAIVERLIQLGFNVNAKADEDITCLHVACSNAREDTIKLLLMKRADTMVPGGVSSLFENCSFTVLAVLLIKFNFLFKNSPKGNLLYICFPLNQLDKQLYR